MAKGRKGSERTDRLEALYAAGDHGAARRAAAELLRDPAAAPDELDAAQALLARTATDKAVAIAGIAGVVVAISIAVWLIVH